MQDFQFYVTDVRYTVPTVMLVQAKDAVNARLIADQVVKARYHSAVEVWQDDRRLFIIRDPASADQTPAAPAPATAPPTPDSA